MIVIKLDAVTVSLTLVLKETFQLTKPWISSSIWNISNKDRMHIYIITTTLLTLYHSNMFQPSKGHPQVVQMIHFISKVNKVCYQI